MVLTSKQNAPKIKLPSSGCFCKLRDANRMAGFLLASLCNQQNLGLPLPKTTCAPTLDPFSLPYPFLRVKGRKDRISWGFRRTRTHCPRHSLSFFPRKKQPTTTGLKLAGPGRQGDAWCRSASCKHQAITGTCAVRKVKGWRSDFPKTTESPKMPWPPS